MRNEKKNQNNNNNNNQTPTHNYVSAVPQDTKSLSH